MDWVAERYGISPREPARTVEVAGKAPISVQGIAAHAPSVARPKADTPGAQESPVFAGSALGARTLGLLAALTIFWPPRVVVGRDAPSNPHVSALGGLAPLPRRHGVGQPARA